MKKTLSILFSAAFVAMLLVGCEEDEEPIKNYYELDGVEYAIDSSMFWYQSGMGGDPYIRLITAVDGQDNPDLIKLYPNKGLNELPGTYTWAAKPAMGAAEAGTYDVGYTADYAGMAYEWTAVGKDGSTDLTITETETGIYHVEGTMTLSVGSYDYSTGVFTETGTKSLMLDYTGAITPL